MRNKYFLFLLLILFTAVPFAHAQTTTTTTSNVSIFFVACANQGVIELSGQMQSGYDIYFQMFSGPAGSGAALSTLRQVVVNGAYTFSEVVPYTGGQTVPGGGVASVKVLIARETDASRSIFDTLVNDVQDGCAQPQLPPGTSTDLGEDGTATTAATPGSGILSPFGGELNPGIPAEPLVKIGARNPEGRTANPGLIFAECDRYPLANPGILYDTDDFVVFWSWFAKTPAQVQDHINHAIYSVKLNGEIFPNVERSEITRRGNTYWVFYVVRLGRFWRPGEYGIEYKLSWDRKITDGFNEYGPGTANETEGSTCTFNILPNPYGIAVAHVAPPMPQP